MDTMRSAASAAHRCTSIPSDDGRASYTVEVLRGDRIALRVGKLSIFFTHSEGRRILAVLSVILGVQVQPTVQL